MNTSINQTNKSKGLTIIKLCVICSIALASTGLSQHNAYQARVRLMVQGQVARPNLNPYQQQWIESIKAQQGVVGSMGMYWNLEAAQLDAKRQQFLAMIQAQQQQKVAQARWAEAKKLRSLYPQNNFAYKSINYRPPTINSRTRWW